MNALVMGRAFFLEATRSRLFLVAFIVTALLVGSSFIIGPISLGTGEKIGRDMGLAALLISAALMIFTGGTHLIGRELERRTAYLFLSRPIHRAEYVVGKFVGVVAVAWTVLAISALVFALTLWMRGDSIETPMLQAMVLTACELCVLSAAVVFFGSIAGPIASMLYAFGLFVAGHTMGGILEMSQDVTVGATRAVVEALRWVLPDLSRFDMRLQAVHGVGVTGADMLWAIGYALLYASALLALACTAFARKELK
jgi:ABC-type transport system involved in multi-copper enzyme maturation permease subunit